MNMAAAYNSTLLIVIGTMAFLLMTAATAPMEPEEYPSENAIVRPDGNDIEYLTPWDSLNTAALRKLLLQLDSDDRNSLGPRVVRSWPPMEPRARGIRTSDSQLSRQWRADKRQVRFRQCYFNPISCFRK